MRYVLIVLTALAVPFVAQAQTITFSAETTTGVEQVTPVLTWDTDPLADDCVASGDWQGSKGGEGTETLDPITTGATYNLTCTWLNETATLSWTPPTQNTDGSPYTDPGGYKIYYGTIDGGPYGIEIDIDNPAVTSWVVEPLTDGVWHFVATAYNQRGVESEFTNQVSKIIGSETDTQSVGITVNPRPAPPMQLSIE